MSLEQPWPELASGSYVRLQWPSVLRHHTCVIPPSLTACPKALSALRTAEVEWLGCDLGRF